MKHILLFLIFCGLALHATSQNNREGYYVNIQPPTAASLMKNIDHPVGLYHGNPEISHTLYTLKDGAVELPITLQYNTSGIKVSEEASWVGLGWHLNVGGMIVQNAVGKLDDKADYNTTYTSDYPQGSFPAYMNVIYRLDDKKSTRIITRRQPKTACSLMCSIFHFPAEAGNSSLIIAMAVRIR